MSRQHQLFEDGGPVHPTSRSESGISKREHFAGLAMQAVLMRGDDTNRPAVAEWSVAMADAMISALKGSAQ